MATLTLEPVSLTPSPDADSNMKVSFRLPSAAADWPLKPATSLQISFANGGQEVFADRFTSRDISVQGDVYQAQLSGKEVPRFSKPVGQTTVTLHAWKGEKWLGKWEVGTL